MKKFFTILVLTLIVFAPFVAGAQVQGISNCSNLQSTGLSGVVNCIVGFMNTAIGLIISAAVLYVIWGAFNMIRSEEKREEGKQTIMYGIIGIFVMVSIWGLVNILNNTFGLKQGPITDIELIKVK